MRFIPSPWHASHRPPFTLKLKRPGLYPRALDSGSRAYRSRIGENTWVYVAGFDRGVRPIGDWSISITLSIRSSPSIDVYEPGSAGDPYTAFGEAIVFGYHYKFKPCYAVATKGKHGGVIGGLGSLLKGVDVPTSGSGFIEIYSGQQSSTEC